MLTPLGLTARQFTFLALVVATVDLLEPLFHRRMAMVMGFEVARSHHHG